MSTDHGKQTLELFSNARRFNTWIFSRLKPFLASPVLEIGSGTGNLSHLALDHGFQLTVSDFNPEYLHILQLKFKDHPRVVDIVSIDLNHENFTEHYAGLNAKFQSIFLSNVLEHIKNDEDAMANLVWMLKPGGNLVVLVPAFNALYNRFDEGLSHYRRYTRRSLSSLFHLNGMSVISSGYFNFPAIPGWWFFGKVLGRSSMGRETVIYDKMVPLFKFIDPIFNKIAGLSVIVAGQKESA